MDSFFGRKKSRPRQSSVSVQDLNERSVPYDRLSAPSRSPITVGIPSKVSSPYSQSTQLHRSEASTSSLRSENMVDFGQYPSSQQYNNFATVRPTSGVSSRSDINRNSKHASSLASSEGGPHHSHLSQFYSRHHHSGNFQFPRPETDAEIELLFENVKRTRDVGPLPNLSVDQKWAMVYNDMQIRWTEEKQREEQSRKQNEAGQSGAILTESPEWYIKRFLDKTITPKQAGSLLVSLRSKELRYELCLPVSLSCVYEF
jgi:cytokinesis protein